MPRPGDFVTTWEDKFKEGWSGYYEPANVFWLTSSFFTSSSGKEIDKTEPTLQAAIEELNEAKPDVNKDGLADRFEVVEQGENFLIKLYRGVRKERTLGCAAGFTLFKEVGFEPEGKEVGSISKKEVEQSSTIQAEWREPSSKEKGKRYIGDLVVSYWKPSGAAITESGWIFTAKGTPISLCADLELCGCLK